MEEEEVGAGHGVRHMLGFMQAKWKKIEDGWEYCMEIVLYGDGTMV